MKRIFGDGGREKSALAVHDRDADAECAEIYSRYDSHRFLVFTTEDTEVHRGIPLCSSVSSVVQQNASLRNPDYA
jgi:hypothetical protein